MAGTYYSHSPVIMGLPVSSTTATLGANDGSLGQRAWRGGVEYMMVYNDCNSEIAPTYGVTVQSGVSTPYSCTLSTTTSADICIGVAHVTLATGAYGWVVTKGVCNVEMEADNSAAVGQVLAIAANGEFALRSASTGYPGGAIGKTLEAVASGASGSAFVNCF